MRISKFFTTLITFYLLLTSVTFAADFSFGIGEMQADGTQDVALLLKTTNSVNALEGVVIVGKNVEVEDISDAGSIVQLWIDKPSTAAGATTITYAGMIPGGFSGEGVVMHLLIRGDPSALSIDKNASQTLLNDGAGTQDQVKILPSSALPEQLTLKVSSDKIPPQDFVPQIAVVPTESGDQLSVLFNTHDDQSGIERYEIAYSDTALDPNDPSLVWATTNSPARVPDSAKSQFIYIKAVDKAGNTRIAEFPQSNAQPEPHNLLYFAILIGVIALAVVIVRYVLHRKYVSTT